ncbi:hypothetical protein P3T37_001654 [Kitasatospora sp. MAA4]|uniref:hypothetical protein n=1 Tax=Kitasatospora sp. MAA4 TaxID=3035093 RepID=UPI0024756C42|nr:hypothetical protein [Kitasatospora sp. MAA4]MDH6132269.1 hypothetical protein [Kitasatospora sp. MAA4]
MSNSSTGQCTAQVTLRGTVPEPSPLGVLDLLARSVPGVVDVQTLISIGPTPEADRAPHD